MAKLIPDSAKRTEFPVQLDPPLIHPCSVEVQVFRCFHLLSCLHDVLGPSIFLILLHMSNFFAILSYSLGQRSANGEKSLVTFS